jgi:hypothetical protein
MQTGSSKTPIGWKYGKTTYVSLWDRMEGPWLWTLYTAGIQDGMNSPGSKVPVNVVLGLEVGHAGSDLGRHVDQLWQLHRSALTYIERERERVGVR